MSNCCGAEFRPTTARCYELSPWLQDGVPQGCVRATGGDGPSDQGLLLGRAALRAQSGAPHGCPAPSKPSAGQEEQNSPQRGNGAQHSLEQHQPHWGGMGAVGWEANAAPPEGTGPMGHEVCISQGAHSPWGTVPTAAPMQANGSIGSTAAPL